MFISKLWWWILNWWHSYSWSWMEVVIVVNRKMPDVQAPSHAGWGGWWLFKKKLPTPIIFLACNRVCTCSRILVDMSIVIHNLLWWLLALLISVVACWMSKQEVIMTVAKIIFKSMVERRRLVETNDKICVI